MKTDDVNRAIETLEHGLSFPSRVQRLADQAKDSIPKDHFAVDEWIVEYNIRFAKLIVNDVIKTAVLWENDSRNHISEILKKHYGVDNG